MRLFEEKWKEYREETEEYHPGSKELKRLSKGMMEDEEQLDELQPWHSKKDGRFPKGGPKAGDTYSLSKPAVKAAGIDDKYAKKGVASSGKDKDGKTKTHGKYGMPDKCGRKSLSGKDISPRYKCSTYKEPYQESVELEESEKDVSREYVRATFANELKDALAQVFQLVQQTGTKGGCSIDSIQRIMNNWALSSKGKLNEPAKQAISEAVVRTLSRYDFIVNKSTPIHSRHTPKKPRLSKKTSGKTPKPKKQNKGE